MEIVSVYYIIALDKMLVRKSFVFLTVVHFVCIIPLTVKKEEFNLNIYIDSNDA